MANTAEKEQYQHKEAFCLMLYQGQTSKRVLDVWNSRDGVTPFIVFIDHEEYKHIAWQFDRCVPDHKLRPGDYFWRAMTEEEAERIAAWRVDRYCPDMSDAERAREVVEAAKGLFHCGESPYLDRAPFITSVGADEV